MKKKKKLKNRKEIKIRETDKQCYQKGKKNKNKQQKNENQKKNWAKKGEKKHGQNELEKKKYMWSSSIKDYIDLEGNYFCTDSSTKFGNNDESGKACKDNKRNNTYINKKENRNAKIK